MKMICVKVLKNEELAKGKGCAYTLGLVVVSLSCPAGCCALSGRAQDSSGLALGLASLWGS